MKKIKNILKKPLENPDEINDPPRPFMEHLIALRTCILHSALSWAICALLAGIFSQDIMEVLLKPASSHLEAGKVQMRISAEDTKAEGKEVKAPEASKEAPKASVKEASENKESSKEGSSEDVEGFRIATLSMTGGFNLIMTIAMWGGLVFGFPFILFNLLKFIFPALTNREKLYIMFFIGAGSACFLAGVSMAYFQLAPKAITFFFKISQWMQVQSEVILVEDYVPLILKLVLAFGLVFQIPLVLFILGWMGVITSETLISFRRFAIVIAFFLGMVLTPPDPMSQLLMAVPLCLFYELCIWGVKAKEVISAKSNKA
jgi:sec-independent protein translocase protein TatC